MADNRTMEELLQAPMEGYGKAIGISKINADHFEIKTNLLQLVQANPYHGFERENPHTHINNFKRITSTLKFRDVPNDVIKLMMFSYSLEGAPRVWYEAWERFKEMLRACRHHEFTELTQIDTFYSGLNDNDQDSLNVAAGENLLTVKESCVTCGGNHAFYNCDATNSNQSCVYAATGTYNQVAPQNHASNYMAPPGFAPVQNNGQDSGFFQNQSSTSSTLPSNTILNPKDDMKAITTRSGVAYEGPSIPTPKKVVEREIEETTDKEQTNFQGSTAHIQPPLVPILEPDSLLANKDKLFKLAKIPLNENCSATLLKKLPEKLGDPGKFLIPCDFPRIDVCHALADLGASINLMPLFIWKKLSLLELTPTRMTLELVDQSITRPKGVTEDVFVKVGKFHFLADFVVVDFEADPRVPLIIGRYFLRTGRALIDVYGEEITLWVNEESVTFNLNQTTRYSYTYDDMSVNRIDVSDVDREEYAQEMLGFSNNSIGGNPTSTFKPIISKSSPSLTPFEGSNFILEEIEAYLKDESISPKIDHADFKAKSSIEEPPRLELKYLPSHLEYAYLEGVDELPVIIAKYLKVDEKEALLKKKTAFTCPYGTFAYRRMPFGLCNALGTFQRCMIAIFHDMIEKTMEVFMDDFSVFRDSFSSCLSHLDTTLQWWEDTNLVLNWEKCRFMVKEGIVLGHKISKNELEFDQTKVDVIAKLPHPTTVKGVRSFLGHAGFYRQFNQYFSTIARPMTYLLEKETPFVFSKDFIDAFETLKKKLTEASILVVYDWNLPFELMCDASDFAIGTFSRQRKTKHFQPIHYASKTMTEVQIHYTMMEKEMLVVVYAFEKFRPYLVLSKSIVYTHHSALKYLLSKQDAKPRLLRWVLLLQEFDIIIRDKKRTENLAADHLSRLENPHKDVFENKDINENFPLETLGKISSGSTQFMNYLEEQTDEEAMINSIKNGDQPLPRVTQVSIAGTTLTEQPPLKDKSM
nr:reverse transcriptase domain-containing protein [Tanacetum cinerariifolium]